MDPITVIAVVVGVLAGLGGGFALGIVHRKRVAEAEIGSAELQAKKILEDGLKAHAQRRDQGS